MSRDYKVKMPIFTYPLTNIVIYSSFWAGQILITRYAFNDGAPLLPYIFQTSLFALVGCCIVLLPRETPSLARLLKTEKRVVARVCLGNMFHTGLGTFFNLMGICYTTATNAAFLAKLGIVFLLFFAHVFLGEHISRMKVLATVGFLLGAYLLITGGRSLSIQIGDIFILLACLSWSTGNTIIKHTMLRSSISGELVAAIRPLVGLPFHLLGCFLLVSLSPELVGPLSSGLLPLALINGLVTALVWIFVNRSLHYGSASYTAFMSNITPMLVAFGGVYFFDESLSFIQWLGCGLIILGGALAHWSEIFIKKQLALRLGEPSKAFA